MKPSSKVSFTPEQLDLIASFRGIPLRATKSKLRAEKGISELIERALKQYKISEIPEENLIIKHWKAIIGSQNAHRCRPQAVTAQGELVIIVSNPTLRTELQMQKRSILSKVQALAPASNIKTIVFRVG